MARIIPLKREGAPTAAGATGLAACAGQGGEIVLFPGIRYERWDGPASGESGRSPGTAAKSGKRRDWLEI